MMYRSYVTIIKKGIVVFWALWYSLVLVTNISDALKAIGLVSQSWGFVSGNYSLIKDVTQLSPGVTGILFTGVLLWEGLVTWLFWRASARKIFKGSGFLPLTNKAFAASLGFWASLILADELFLVYKTMGLETEHLGILVAHLISLLTIHLLQDNDSSGRPK